MIPDYVSPLANHLWQSTIVTAAVALLSFALRRNSARVRYWLWFLAAMKFLVPFSLLVTAGQQLEWRNSPAVAQRPISTVVGISTPFESNAVVSMPAERKTTAPKPDMIAVGLPAIWLCGVVVSLGFWIGSWLRMREALHSAKPFPLETPHNLRIRTLSSPALLEPAVFGIFRPALMLPRGIERRMPPEQLKAVIVHELCHIRRRDNLATAIYMVTETLFWFYPLVRWIGKRMIAEREHACDAEVLRLGHEPSAYAEGILHVCKSYLESPLHCATGVTGSDLKVRIRTILSGQTEFDLSFAKKALLTTAGVAAIASPIAVGVLNPRLLRADSLIFRAPGQPRLSFEVTSVKPVDRALMVRNHEGNRLDREIYVDRAELYAYIVLAYVRGNGCLMKLGAGEVCPLIGGSIPSWVRTDRYEIQGKFFPNSVPGYSDRQRRNNDRREVSLVLQSMLEDRFHLKAHREIREIPVYAITVGKNTPKLKATHPKGDQLNQPDGSVSEVHGMSKLLALPGPDGTPRIQMTFQASTMQEAVEALSAYFDKPVLDRTHLKGEYDFSLECDRDPTMPQPDHVDMTSGRGGGYFNPFTGLSSAALSVCLQDIGLKLESTKAPIEILVIDQVERPSQN